MKKYSIIYLTLSLLTNVSNGETSDTQSKASSSENRIIADFKSDATSLKWKSVNDGVMGGVSQGSSYITEASHLYFKGRISLKNNGGFSSIRTSGSKHDLSAYTGLSVRIKGDGRMYYLTSRVNGSRMLAYWSPIQTIKDKWITIKVPFDSFYATSFGRKIPGKKLDTAKISSFGFMLYDKKAGDFSIEVSELKSYK